MTDTIDKKDEINKKAIFNNGEDISKLILRFYDFVRCLENKTEPEKESEEINGIDFRYNDIKILYDLGLISNKNFLESFDVNRIIPEEVEYGSHDFEYLSKVYGNFDLVLPNFTKDGMYNLLIESLKNHPNALEKSEINYIVAYENNRKINVISNDEEREKHRKNKESSFKKRIDKIKEISKNDKKAHFVLTDMSPENIGNRTGHITPYVIIDGNIFEFDSIGIGIYEGKEYSTKFIQQSDRTSCRTIAIKEIEDFLKMLDKISVDEFLDYLKQFFPENNEELYFVSEKEEKLILEEKNKKEKQSNAKKDDFEEDNDKKKEQEQKYKLESKNIKNKRRVLLPFPVIKHLQSETNLNEILEALEGSLENYEKRFVRLCEAIDKEKLRKLIKKYNLKNMPVENSNKFTNINSYDITQKLKQFDILRQMYEKGLIVDNCEIIRDNNGIITFNKDFFEYLDKVNKNTELLENKLQENNINLTNIEDLIYSFDGIQVNLGKLEKDSRTTLFNIFIEEYNNDIDKINFLMENFKISGENLAELISLSIEKENYSLMNNLIKVGNEEILSDLVHFAIKNKNKKLFETLVKENIINDNKFIPIDSSVILEEIKKGENEVIDILLDQKGLQIDPFETDKQKNNLLHLAVINGNSKLIAKLFENGIYESLMDEENFLHKTPNDCVEDINNEEIKKKVESLLNTIDERIEYKKTFELNGSLYDIKNEFNQDVTPIKAGV